MAKTNLRARMMRGAFPVALLCGCLASLLTACAADNPMNPSFALKYRDAVTALDEMEKQPAPLSRPVVILAGLWDPGLATDHIADELRKVADESATFIEVSFIGAGDFDECRERVLDAVNEALPSADSKWTAAVDVVAVSMGGLVARYAAGPRADGGHRLNMIRLFTLSTPHRGANLAWVNLGDRRIAAMNGGSPFLVELDEALPDSQYELVPYVRLGDSVVGVRNAAPPGRGAWWVATPAFDLAHARCAHDARILADIARRLRGEAPYTADPPAPLPGRPPAG